MGVNRHVDDAQAQHEPRLFTLDPEIGELQIARTERRKAARDGSAAGTTLATLREALRGGANIMPPIMDCARVGVTLGEMSDVMRDEFGEFREPSPW